jgi:hypothetical protein
MNDALDQNRVTTTAATQQTEPEVVPAIASGERRPFAGNWEFIRLYFQLFDPLRNFKRPEAEVKRRVKLERVVDNFSWKPIYRPR